MKINVKNRSFFLVIGAQKAGTTWLWEQLRKHPDIWMPPIKELHFFDYLYIDETHHWASDHIKKHVGNELKKYLKTIESIHIDYDYVRYLTSLASKDVFTEEWYSQAFSVSAADNKVLGDITPEYSLLSNDGINYVRDFFRKI